MKTRAKKLDGGSLLSPEQVATRLGVSKRTLRIWVVTGKFPAGLVMSRQVVRWEPATVEEFLAGLRV